MTEGAASVATETTAPTDASAPSAEVAEDLAAIAAIEGDLQAVDTALRRLDDGSYRTCASCGRPIDAGLLGQDPLRNRCARCESGQGQLPLT